MNKTFTDFGRIIYIVGMAALNYEKEGDGAQKKKAVTEEVLKVIAEKKGIDLPDWAVPIVKVFLPGIIEYAVRNLNKLDLLGKLKNG